MNFEPVAKIADALLYEGYLLYPYRSSSVKNQQRFTFGCLLPPAFAQAPGSTERSFLQTECLLLGDAATRIDIRVRFLHLTTRRGDAGPTWQKAVAREIDIAAVDPKQLPRAPTRREFTFPSSPQSEGIHLRTQQAIEGAAMLSAQRCGEDTIRLRVRIENHTPIGGDCRTREDALAWSLLSCHLLLGVRGGAFVSLLDPPVRLREAAAACDNVGVYPVLAGDGTKCDTMLAAPIILYDYPRIAAASPGDLFDGTEMDEMLTLRIQTLTSEEKRDMAQLDPRAEQLLARCENLPPEQQLGLHGVWHREESGFQPGMRVRLKPKGNADAFDLALAGKTAVIVGIEEDFENQIYVTVAVDDDPGQDLGVAGKPGHRFFFRPDEVEPLADDKETRRQGDKETGRPAILVAGIGNIFFGDDAFGVEVVRQLTTRSWPAHIVVKDFGIRGYDLACALQDGYDTIILVDALSRGSLPGTLHVLELDPAADASAGDLEMHRLDLAQVLKLVRHMGGRLPRLRLVGCEPATLEPAVELSDPVRRAVAEAVAVIESLIAEWSFHHAKT